MDLLLAILGLWALVPLSFMLLERALTGRLPRRPAWLRMTAAPMPTAPPVERIAADLRRLAHDLELIERSDHPRKVARLRASSMAYDDVLLEACRALEVAAPVAHPPLCPADRLQAEAGLACAGLRW